MAKSGFLSRPTWRKIHDHLCLSLIVVVLAVLSRVDDEAFASALSADFLHPFLASLTFVVLTTYLTYRGPSQSRDTADATADGIKAIQKRLDA